jgi:hypothetical protein
MLPCARSRPDSGARREDRVDDRRDENAASAAKWTFIFIAVLFKGWGVALVLMNDSSRASIEMNLLLNWPYLAPLLLGIPAIIFWSRLFRGRLRRARYLREEFSVSAGSDGASKPR